MQLLPVDKSSSWHTSNMPLPFSTALLDDDSSWGGGVGSFVAMLAVIANSAAIMWSRFLFLFFSIEIIFFTSLYISCYKQESIIALIKGCSVYVFI